MIQDSLDILFPLHFMLLFSNFKIIEILSLLDCKISSSQGTDRKTNIKKEHKLISTSRALITLLQSTASSVFNGITEVFC